MTQCKYVCLLSIIEMKHPLPIGKYSYIKLITIRDFLIISSLFILQDYSSIFCCLLPPGGRCGAQHVPQIGDRSAGAREYEPRAGKAVHSSRPTATKHILVYRDFKKIYIGNIFDV